MGIRIQPKEVKICKDDPFKHDLLDRKEIAEVLTNLVGNIEGPCAMAVDAAWGAGKTTFLEMWAQHLRNEGFPVIAFNAWETDASGDPFVALTSEIAEGLKEYGSDTFASNLERFESVAKDLLRKFGPGAIRVLAGLIPVGGSELGHALSNYAEEAFGGYLESKQTAEEFQSSLHDLAKAICESNGQKPVVVLVDELDRCRPSYAIELLETAKHIFGVDHVVFVLALNREQLAHSVKALYGSEFDAEGYLRRFFDIDFWLPAPDRDGFIHSTLSAVGVYQFFEETSDQFARDQGKDVCEILTLFLSCSDLSLRNIGQALHRFALVLSSLGNSKNLHLPTLTALSALNAVDPPMYRKFVEGESTTEDTLEAVFEKSNFEPLRRTTQGAIFEAVIIAARLTRPVFHLMSEDIEKESPSLGAYARILEEARSGQITDRIEVDRARFIYDWAGSILQSTPRGSRTSPFNESVQRLELLSADLI